MAAILKMAAEQSRQISMFSDFNENWYLGLFWREELIGNDENCILDHFQIGRRYNGNYEHMSKSLTSLISETAKGISTRLGIYIK